MQIICTQYWHSDRVFANGLADWGSITKSNHIKDTKNGT